MRPVGRRGLRKPIGLKWRSSTLFIISTVGIGLFTDLFLYGLIVPILPFILESRIGTPRSQIQQQTSVLLSTYACASFVASLPAGIIADKLSARRVPFLAGLLALLVATIMLFLGRSIAVLVVARVLQGVSGAIVWTVGLALVLDTVGYEKLGATIGTIFSFISVGELAAPVLGGSIYETAGLSSVLALGSAFLAIDLLMRLLVIERKTAARYTDSAEENVDPDDANSDSMEDANEGEGEQEESPLLDHGKAKDEEWKIKNEQPRLVQMFPILYCLSNSRFLTAEAVAIVQATLVSAFDATIPTEAQHLFGVDSLKAGLLFIPLTLPYLLLGFFAGKSVDKYGPKPAAAIGMAYLIPVLILLRIPQAGGTAEVVKFCIVLAFCGIGLAFISAPSIVEASYVTMQYHKANKELFGEEGPYAQLYAIQSMVFNAGLTLGPLVAGALRDSIGYGNMNAVIAGLCGVVSILSYVYLGGKPKLLRKREL